MPKIDIASVPVRRGTIYPKPFNEGYERRIKQALGNAGGLTQFGVNLTRLEPGAASAMRHWHEQEDEFVYILEGEATLIDDAGETVLRPGDAAAFKAGDPNGHHLVNNSDADVVFLEVGTRSPTERAHYPDDDIAAYRQDGGFRFTRKNGEPFEQG